MLRSPFTMYSGPSIPGSIPSLPSLPSLQSLPSLPSLPGPSLQSLKSISSEEKKVSGMTEDVLTSTSIATVKKAEPTASTVDLNCIVYELPVQLPQRILTRYREVVAADGRDASPPCGVVSIQGRRPRMEDAVCVKPIGPVTVPTCGSSSSSTSTSTSGSCDGSRLGLGMAQVFAVFDGHGGHKVSAYCAAKLPEKLKEAMPPKTRTTIRTAITDIGSLVRNAIISLHHDVCDALSEADACGTTALVAVQHAGRFCIAHCGDSRAVLCENNIARQLTVDHKPDVPEERDRILAAGGLVFRRHNHGQSMVMGLLAMSRALGDAHLDPYISHEPDVMTFECTPGMQFLLLASDGLFDVMDNQTAVELALQSLGHPSHLEDLCSLDGPGNTSTSINTNNASTSINTNNTSRAAKCQSAAGRLVLEAARRGATDNISVVVVDLTGMPPKNKHDSDSCAK